MRKILLSIAVAAALVCGVEQQASATALSAIRNTSSKNGGAIKQYLMKASTTIYAGGMVALDSNGLAIPAAASAAAKGVVGLAVASKTSAASGSTYVQAQEGWFLLAGTTLAQSNQGALVYAADDQTVDDARGTNYPVAGLLIEYVSASSAWVWLSPNFAGRMVVEMGSLTLDDSAGLTLKNGATIVNSTDGAIAFGETSEDLINTFTSNTVTLSSSTGVNSYSFGSIPVTAPSITVNGTETLANGETISNATDGKVKLAGAGATNNEDLSLDFETTANTVTLSSSTGVTTVDSGAIGYKSSSATPLEFTATSDMGWAVVTGVNTACNTTCVHACVVAFASGGQLVACTDATADVCLCAGSN